MTPVREHVDAAVSTLEVPGLGEPYGLLVLADGTRLVSTMQHRLRLLTPAGLFATIVGGDDDDDVAPPAPFSLADAPVLGQGLLRGLATGGGAPGSPPRRGGGISSMAATLRLPGVGAVPGVGGGAQDADPGSPGGVRGARRSRVRNFVRRAERTRR